MSTDTDQGDNDGGNESAGAAEGGPPTRARWPRWLTRGSAGAAVVVAALLVAVLVLRGGGGSGGTSPEALARQALLATATAPGIGLPTGELLALDRFPGSGRQAPDFSLTDQAGQQVSLSQFRGRSVVLSFNDDECTDLCTLLAQDIVAANRDLGSARRNVVWLSVNVNSFHPEVAAVRAWTDGHGLGSQPNWYFGTAQPSRLRPIWAKYGIYVGLGQKAGTVVHGTEMFFIDPSGRERAIAEFGTESASTALFAHGIAQMADDLLPPAERARVGGPATPPPSKGSAAVGATAPGFSLPYLAGGEGHLGLASLRGRYAVVNFWASTCTVCRTELPALEAAYQEVGSHVAFVGVDVSDSPGAARAMAQRAGITYALLKDAGGAAAAQERITGLPFTVILGPQGRILVRHPGDLTTEQLVYVLRNEVPALGRPAG
ncbi:MAG: redoxin domain-containing protein [Acidimicrobiales bacterium]